MVALTDRHIGTVGTSELHWARVRADIPMLDLDQLVGRDTRLVVVAPHPDDELLACGGLIAMHVARGGRTFVIGVTDGEASHPGSATWTTSALTQARGLERQRGLTLLGVSEENIARLRFPDGQVSRYAGPLQESLGRLLTCEDVVVTTWSLDGHPDHDAVGRATQSVCADVGAVCLQAPVWMWHWSHAGDPRVPWERLRGTRLGRAPLESKMCALSEHRTQLALRDAENGAVLDALILERAQRTAEYFFLAR